MLSIGGFGLGLREGGIGTDLGGLLHQRGSHVEDRDRRDVQNLVGGRRLWFANGRRRRSLGLSAAAGTHHGSKLFRPVASARRAAFDRIQAGAPLIFRDVGQGDQRLDLRQLLSGERSVLRLLAKQPKLPGSHGRPRPRPLPTRIEHERLGVVVQRKRLAALGIPVLVPQPLERVGKLAAQGLRLLQAVLRGRAIERLQFDHAGERGPQRRLFGWRVDEECTGRSGPRITDEGIGLPEHIGLRIRLDADGIPRPHPDPGDHDRPRNDPGQPPPLGHPRPGHSPPKSFRVLGIHVGRREVVPWRGEARGDLHLAQRGFELRHARESRLRVLLQTTQDHLVERGGRRDARARGLGPLAELREQDVGGVLALERTRPGRQLVQRAAQRVDVGPVIAPDARYDLWGQVGRRARARLGRLRVIPHLGDPEVQQFDRITSPLIDPEHDVLRLDVAVNDAGVVCRSQALADLTADGDDPIDGEHARGFERCAQRLALDEFHRDHQPPVGELDEVVHVDYEPRSEPTQRSCFSAKQLDDRGAERIPQHLEGDTPVEVFVHGFEDGPHAAVSEPPHQAVTGSRDQRTGPHGHGARGGSDRQDRVLERGAIGKHDRIGVRGAHDLRHPVFEHGRRLATPCPPRHRTILPHVSGLFWPNRKRKTGHGRTSVTRRVGSR